MEYEEVLNEKSVVLYRQLCEERKAGEGEKPLLALYSYYVERTFARMKLCDAADEKLCILFKMLVELADRLDIPNGESLWAD